ncbi:iron ABC transporter permease [Actinopolymorpha sp. B17G11]|uniref:FecCD family ABC transporter permease n=1 Tax=Actinopolymorpha sp. B17G11 TaxID=3160861 RepID=UPI0032E43188
MPGLTTGRRGASGRTGATGGRGATPKGGVSRRLLLLAALVPVVALLSLAIGSNASSPAEVWHALTSASGQEADTIVRTLRFPRTVLGLLVGACLGAAGVLMQGHTRNPLAEPGLLGVSAGAAFCVVLGLRLRLVETLEQSVYAAIVGALVASLAVYAMARSSLHEGGARLVVAGAATTAFLAALTSGIVLLDAQSLDAYRFWAVGSLSGRDPDTGLVILPFAMGGLLIALVNARSLDLLALGDDVSTAMGLSVTRSRLAGLAAVALLTAAGVAACGPIAFVGLLAGQLARAVTGARWMPALVAGSLVGALVLVSADVAGRVVAGQGELQVGVVAGVLGAPVLIWVVRRRGLAL